MIGLLDTNVLVAIDQPGEPVPDLHDFDDLFVASLSYSELTLGLHTTTDLATYKKRSARLAQLTQTFGPGLPYDDDCVQAYGQIVEHIATLGGDPKARVIDRMIAATAMAHHLTVVTRNAAHFANLAALVPIVVR
jgi:predicted nucleic acid-binding protein